MLNHELGKAESAVDEVIDIISDLAEKHADSNKELFDELILAKEKLEPVNDWIDEADDEINRLEELERNIDEDTEGLTDYDTHNTGFGDVHIKCENESDHQLFMALLDCLKQPNVNRNHLLGYLHQRAGLMAGFHS